MDETTQKMILDKLNELSTGQTKMVSSIGDLTTQVAVVKSQLIAGENRFKQCDSHNQRTAALESRVSVIDEKLTPLQRIVYGMVGIILASLLTAVVYGAIK